MTGFAADSLHYDDVTRFCELLWMRCCGNLLLFSIADRRLRTEAGAVNCECRGNDLPGLTVMLGAPHLQPDWKQRCARSIE